MLLPPRHQQKMPRKKQKTCVAKDNYSWESKGPGPPNATFAPKK